MKETIYDYAIIGAGAAGMHLIQAMLRSGQFADKRIILVEKSDKDIDDKTWSFWEKGEGYWDSILTKSWEKGEFYSGGKSIPFHLEPYRYKTIRSLHFYEYNKEKIATAEQIEWVKDEVQSIQINEPIEIVGKKKKYLAQQVFDSRIEQVVPISKQHIYIAQHFKGWEIETSSPTFDPTTFVMMDFRIKWKDSASFTYVLPTSPTTALVEFTLFTPELIKESDYDEPLRQYISEVLKIEEYRIKKEEYGVIPMSNYPYHKASKKGVLKIGTAGSWVKPSSGYAFKNIERCAAQVVQNILTNQALDKDLLRHKFRFYDAIYLNVLHQENRLGESIYQDMYSKNRIQQIFKFLEEETSLWEDIRILHSFKYWPFIKGLGNYVKARLWG